MPRDIAGGFARALGPVPGGFVRGVQYRDEKADRGRARGIQERGLGLQERGLGLQEQGLDLRRQEMAQSEQAQQFAQLTHWANIMLDNDHYDQATKFINKYISPYIGGTKFKSLKPIETPAGEDPGEWYQLDVDDGSLRLYDRMSGKAKTIKEATPAGPDPKGSDLGKIPSEVKVALQLLDKLGMPANKKSTMITMLAAANPEALGEVASFFSSQKRTKKEQALYNQVVAILSAYLQVSTEETGGAQWSIGDPKTGKTPGFSVGFGGGGTSRIEASEEEVQEEFDRLRAQGLSPKNALKRVNEKYIK